MPRKVAIPAAVTRMSMACRKQYDDRCDVHDCFLTVFQISSKPASGLIVSWTPVQHFVERAPANRESSLAKGATCSQRENAFSDTGLPNRNASEVQ
jgi:hypothetical protein